MCGPAPIGFGQPLLKRSVNTARKQRNCNSIPSGCTCWQEPPALKFTEIGQQEGVLFVMEDGDLLLWNSALQRMYLPGTRHCRRGVRCPQGGRMDGFKAS